MGFQPWLLAAAAAAAAIAATDYRSVLRAPGEFCGVYDAPACLALTANASVALGVRQTFAPDGAFTEEGVWAPGTCGHGVTGVARYRIFGTFRDHGAETRPREAGVRKVVLDIRKVLVVPLPGAATLEAWRAACPCNNRAWEAFEEVDVVARCAGSCKPFVARSVFFVASLEIEDGKLCASKRRTFDESWPSRQALELCFEKQADMRCSASPSPSAKALRAEVPMSPVQFDTLRYGVEALGGVPLAAMYASLQLEQDGTFLEKVTWALGIVGADAGHVTTTAAGRWHHHGSHPFATGLARLRVELQSVMASPTDFPLCLEEGCAPPSVVLRLLCPCGGGGAWAAGVVPRDLLECPSGSCSLGQLFPREAFFMAGQAQNGSTCFSVRESVRFSGWGINNTEILSCSCDGSRNCRRPAGGKPSSQSGTAQHAEGAATHQASEPLARGPAQDPAASREGDASPASKTDRPKDPAPLASVPLVLGGGVTFFEEPDYKGRSVHVKEGKHALNESGLGAFRSAQIPSGWRLAILAPLVVRGKNLGGSYPLFRSLVMDLPNITARVEATRPWLKSEEFRQLQASLTFEVSFLDLKTTKGARISTASCAAASGHTEAVEETLVLALLGESSDRVELPERTGGRSWQSISVDSGFKALVKFKNTAMLDLELRGSAADALAGACAPLPGAPAAAELLPDCSSLDDCSGPTRGVCRRPHECVCRLFDGWTGPSCALGVPDRSTSLVCESIVAFVGSPLECRVHARRSFEVVPASPDVIGVKFAKGAEHLGRLEVDAWEERGEGASRRLTFWPKAVWVDRREIFELTLPPTLAFIGSIKGAFLPAVSAMAAPELRTTCEVRLEENDEGHYKCRIRFEAQPSRALASVPLSLLSVSLEGGRASSPRCTEPSADGVLCSVAVVDVEVTAVVGQLSIKLWPTGSRTNATLSVAEAKAKLDGPSKTRTHTSGWALALEVFGFSHREKPNVWKQILRRVCGALETSRVALSPSTSLAEATAALAEGNSRRALAAAARGRVAAEACNSLGLVAALTPSEASLRALGIVAAVEWRLFGDVTQARKTAAACLLAARGDRDAERWANLCLEVEREVRLFEDAGLRARAAMLENASWFNAIGYVEKAATHVPIHWNVSLDTESATRVRELWLEVEVALCNGRWATISASAVAGDSFVNETLQACAHAAATIESGQRRWPQVQVFGEEADTWIIRLLIVRIEVLLFVGDTNAAFDEVLRGMTMGSDKGGEQEILSELLKRIFRARSKRSQHGEQERKSYYQRDEEADAATQAYELLGVPRNSSDAEVKKAYRQLALIWHPDKQADKDEAQTRFVEITQAYEFIMADAERRRKAGGEAARPRGGNTPEAGKEDEDEGAASQEEREADEKEGDHSSDDAKTGRGTQRSADDTGAAGAGYELDPLSNVAMPRHCCIAGARLR